MHRRPYRPLVLVGMAAAVALAFATSAAAERLQRGLTLTQAHHAIRVYERPFPPAFLKISDCRRISHTAIVCRVREVFDLEEVDAATNAVLDPNVKATFTSHRVVRRRPDGRVVVMSMWKTVRLPGHSR